MSFTSPPHTSEVDSVLERVLRAESTGEFVICNRAVKRLKERNAHAADVQRALLTATHATRIDEGNWKIKGGTNIDGDELDFVVDISATPIRVVTIICIETETA